MKAVLVVLLIAAIACGLPEEFFKIAKCILESPTIWEIFPKIVEAIVNKDYMSIVTIVLAAFAKIKKEVEECLAK